MRIPQNKRGLIVNKEYSRLPYMTDEGYDDVQRSTSQKFVQDNYGKFDESENQQPYKNDSEYDTDYQGLEYDYSLPGFDFNLGDLDIDPSSTTSKDIKCDAYWNQLFPGHPTGSGPFIPGSDDLFALDIYAKKCPVEFKHHICCGRGLKVQGPVNGEMESGQNYKFSVGNKPIDCEYDFWAKKGSMRINGDYTAPQTDVEIFDTMGLEPWTGRSGKVSKDCLTWEVKIKPKTGDCKGRVTVTAPTMAAGASQTLTVQGWVAGEVYSWSTTTGSLDVATGNSAVYTAPASNANCASNPTITLSCGGNVVDTITIAISITNNYKAYTYKETWPQESSNSCGDLGGSCHGATYYFRMTAFDCMGQPHTWSGTPVTCTSYWCNGASPCKQESEISCYCLGTLGPFPGSMQDNRTAAQKAAGCCPAALL